MKRVRSVGQYVVIVSYIPARHRFPHALLCHSLHAHHSLFLQEAVPAAPLPTFFLHNVSSNSTTSVPTKTTYRYNRDIYASHSLTVNTIVFVSTTNTASPALAIQSSGFIPAIGVVISKPTPITATVQYSGEIDNFVGLVPGETYYLSDTVAGTITATAPTSTGSVVPIIGYAKDATTLILDIGDVIYL